MARRIIGSLCSILLLALGPGCDEALPSDAGAPGVDAGSGDAGEGECTEFDRRYCPREYPMVPIPADQICEAFVDAFCRANGLCCSDEARVYDSFDDCVLDQMERCEDDDIGFEFPELVSSGAILYNQGAAGSQFASLATMGDMCVPIRYGDEILEIYRGQTARGAACVRSVECEDDGVCVDSGASMSCIGAPMRLDSCTNNDDCAPAGLRCNEASECDFRLEIDEPCNENRDCETLFCRSGFCFEATPDFTYCVDLDEPGPAFE